jgi:hypothetical protein
VVFNNQEFVNSNKFEVIKPKSGMGRLDLVATIQVSPTLRKKVAIEIQQESCPEDLIRFRTYLANHYSDRSNVIIDSGKVLEVLPIISIYILGFKLDAIPDVVIKAGIVCTNGITGNIINGRDKFVDALTHNVYIIQIPLLTENIFAQWYEQNSLIRMLSFFEQKHFVEGKQIKKYPHQLTDNQNDKILKTMKKSLAFIAQSPAARRAMQEEELKELSKSMYEAQIDALTNENSALRHGMINAGLDPDNFLPPK